MATVMEKTADVVAKATVLTGHSPAISLKESRVLPEQRENLTIAEAEALAEGRPYELIDGRMVFKMADRKHSKSQGILVAKLFNYFEQNPIGQVLPEFSLHLWPENLHNFRVLDIAVFLNENLHEDQDYETRGPDLAIEIVSDDDKISDVFTKARLYLEKGSRVVWIVFPGEKSVFVITPNERRLESNTLTCPEVLPGFSVPVEKIFP